VLRWRWFVFLMLITLLPAAAWAQKFEISPFAGLRYGGEFGDEWDDFYWADLEVDDGPSYGLTLGFSVTKAVQVELMWSRQSTELVETAGLFEGEVELFDLDVDYYHVAVLYQWTPGHVRPFVVASLGATAFHPEPWDLDDETRFSSSFGGGVKVMVGENFGLRLEGRFFSTFVDEDEDAFCDCGCSSCGHCDCHGHRRHWDDDYLFQGEVRAGLIFAF